MTKEELERYQKIINKEKIEQIENINKKIEEIVNKDNSIDNDGKKINVLKKF